MTAVAGPTDRRSRAGRVALAAGYGVLGPIGALAVVVWVMTGNGVGSRLGWTPGDPTLYRDGLEVWFLVAGAVTAVDLVLLLGVHLLVGRLAGPRGGTPLAWGVHLLVAVGLALAYLGGAWR